MKTLSVIEFVFGPRCLGPLLFTLFRVPLGILSLFTGDANAAYACLSPRSKPLQSQDVSPVIQSVIIQAEHDTR